MALISHSEEFIFIHNYKVAGTSIRHALNNRNLRAKIEKKKKELKSSIGSVIGLNEWKKQPAHVTAKELKEQYPIVFEEYYTFAFVRNPWSWQVSLYFYMLEHEDHKQHELIKKMNDFSEYIYWRVSEDKHFQKDFVTNEDDEIIVDYVGKLENISTDFGEVCDNIGIKAELPHENSSSHGSYKEYYNKEARELVEEHFEPDIKLFNYDFE